ncbi:vitamin B12 ABC transporter permease BtuC [Halogeometricum limi]|uniref:Cobalamin import system permease protein BtuC n=1 Tax=Halogeometricum limi TaxID=555875 RepID=A0A1I6GX40_9EURY|nr:vitamin B12 ABC transporter permease BtuC [Halogeometricum limi]SFR46750.1 iron complex transport system permease protein [Halogeometricum limi]
MTVRTRALAWSGGLSVLLVAVVLASAGVGPVAIPPVTVTKAVLGDLLPSTGFAVPKTHRVIVVSVRLPRILLAALVGFALATAGVVMQGFFRNPMADPSIIGVSSGAAVGAVATIVLPFALPFGLELQGAAFASALVTAFAVYLLATRDGQTPTATLLLAGVAVQTFLGAVISFMLLHSGQSLRRVVYWLMGHLSGATWHEVAVAASLLPPLFVVLLVYTDDMNVLLLGESDAHSLGIEVERTKRILLAVSSVVTAAAVAVSGVIGFVGLVVPHAMRLVVGPDHRVLLPTSALAGASFLVATDTLARSGATEIPVGIVTAAIGAPFFLYLLRTREVHGL